MDAGNHIGQGQWARFKRWLADKRRALYNWFQAFKRRIGFKGPLTKRIGMAGEISAAGSVTATLSETPLKSRVEQLEAGRSESESEANTAAKILATGFVSLPLRSRNGCCAESRVPSMVPTAGQTRESRRPWLDGLGRSPGFSLLPPGIQRGQGFQSLSSTQDQDRDSFSK